jgi:hypothetical protein
VRFVVDHAPCQVLLIWPSTTPSVATLPPFPKPPHKTKPPHKHERTADSG